MKKEFDVLIFDYGNTLVFDPFRHILRMKTNEFQGLLTTKGYKIRWQHLAQSWIAANEKIDLPFISHFYQEEVIVEQALKKAGIENRDVATIGQELLSIYRRGFKEVLNQDSRRIEIIQIMTFLKNRGLKLGVLSNERESVLNLALHCYEIFDFLDLVLSSEKVKVEKPDVEIFRYALEALNSRPETSIYVGDDPIRDILPAKKIGMKTVLFVPPREYSLKTSWRSYDYPRISPDFVIKKLAELRQIV